jgi:hypothetical protein
MPAPSIPDMLALFRSKALLFRPIAGRFTIEIANTMETAGIIGQTTGLPLEIGTVLYACDPDIVMEMVHESILEELEKI